MLQKNISDNAAISIEEEQLFNKKFDITKILGATPQYGIEILEQHFHPLYKKFTTILLGLQKYAYVEDKWDTSGVSHGVKRLTAEDIKAQFGLNSGNFVSFLSHRSNPFSPEVIRSHISYLIDTTKKASKYIVTKSTINEIKNITNELIKTGESLTTLLTHYNKLRLLVPVEEESFKLRSTIREIGSDSGNKVGKRPTLEKYDKQRDYYESEDPATLPTHFHVSDEMLDVVHYKYDHQEN